MSVLSLSTRTAERRRQVGDFMRSLGRLPDLDCLAETPQSHRTR